MDQAAITANPSKEMVLAGEPLRVEDVDFREIRALAAAVLREFLKDARRNPVAAAQEVADGNLNLWLQILDLNPEETRKAILAFGQHHHKPHGDPGALDRPAEDWIALFRKHDFCMNDVHRELGADKAAIMRSMRRCGALGPTEGIRAFRDRITAAGKASKVPTMPAYLPTRRTFAPGQLLRALENASWSLKSAAYALGVSDRTVQRHLLREGLLKPGERLAQLRDRVQRERFAQAFAAE